MKKHKPIVFHPKDRGRNSSNPNFNQQEPLTNHHYKEQHIRIQYNPPKENTHKESQAMKFQNSISNYHTPPKANRFEVQLFYQITPTNNHILLSAINHSERSLKSNRYPLR